MSESKVVLTSTQIQLLERICVLHEQSGLAPAVAKVLALLVVSDVTELSFDEIKDTLGISKSATSTAINMLLSTNRIEYVNKLGDRKRYFRLRLGQWKEDIKKRNEEIRNFAAIMKQVLAQRPGNTTEFNSNLKEIIDFVEFLSEELPSLYAKWERMKK